MSQIESSLLPHINFFGLAGLAIATAGLINACYSVYRNMSKPKEEDPIAAKPEDDDDDEQQDGEELPLFLGDADLDDQNQQPAENNVDEDPLALDLDACSGDSCEDCRCKDCIFDRVESLEAAILQKDVEIRQLRKDLRALEGKLNEEHEEAEEEVIKVKVNIRVDGLGVVSVTKGDEE